MSPLQAISQPELRQCDFCQAFPAGWRIQCRPFHLTQGAFAGARLGVREIVYGMFAHRIGSPERDVEEEAA